MFEQALWRANEKLPSDDSILYFFTQKSRNLHLSVIRDSHVNYCSLKCSYSVWRDEEESFSKSVLYLMNVGSVKGDTLL